MGPGSWAWLIPLEQAGKIDVEEEFKQYCFHISVYKSYMAEKVAPASNPQTPLASRSPRVSSVTTKPPRAPFTTPFGSRCRAR